MFKKVNPRQNFPEMEKDILKFWEENEIFKKSIDNRSDKKTYSFFDGPPFATGMPHYGHVVANVMKDVVPRYWTMRGYRVERKWGWDCHGLPVENLIEKELEIKNKQEIEDMGIDKFNEVCCSSVLRYADEWKKFIPRIGRWVDMENDYRTMDWKYTESIWWVFSELYKKGLVYEGYKPMHICPRCETTLSNFEVTQGYKDITDLSATVKFKLRAGQKIGGFDAGENTFVLAWTTTPWTLPGNVALAVGNSIKYQVVSIKGESSFYVLAKDRVEEILEDKEFEVLSEIDSKELVGLEYEPLFNYYANKRGLASSVEAKPLEFLENAYKIYPADFVSTEDGTGVVHIAPAFGNDDMKLAEKYNLPFIQHVGMNGRFKNGVVDFREKIDLQKGSTALQDYGANDANTVGREVKPKRNPRETDEKIVKWLEENNKLFSKENYKHSYPHCWRCDTPLLNYATSSWFVKVTDVKDKMVANNKKINWTPEYIKEGRFGKWLEDARDWAVSRSRYWGAPLPIWRCKKCKNIEVIDSIDKLREQTDQKITKFILLRHGESENNVKDIKAGQLDGYPLTKKGIKQVEEAVEILKKEKIDFIISSPILRTKQTADLVNNVLKVERIEDERIKEYDFGSWNGHSRNDSFCKEDELYKEYKKLANNSEKYNFKFGGDGESRQDIENRVREFIEEVVEKYAGKNILVVGHGGINAMFHRVVERVSIKNTYKYEFMLGNAKQRIFYMDEDKKEFDLHRPNIDKIEIKCSQCGSKAKITGDVFDCWFESGSMPYAQWHYPFENKDKFEKGFPAEFIAEGLDQTRGWFYTLIVLATALFEKPAFRNVIVNGIVMAEDGQKMSKRLKNYPEPDLLVEKYGADALRYYLLISPVMKAENLRFSERGVDEVLKKFILTLWNIYSFLVMNSDIDKQSDKYSGTERVAPKSIRSSNLLDKWILSEFNILVEEVNKQMQNYDLARAARPLNEFVDKLSNWYVRRSRKRFVSENIEDKKFAFQTLHYVLTEYAKLFAPFMPFLAEEIYQNLTDKESVHLEDFPISDKNLIDWRVSEKMNFVRDVVTVGLAIRAKNGLKVRQPLAELRIKNYELRITEELLDLIKDELNVKKVEFVESLQIGSTARSLPRTAMRGDNGANDLNNWICEEDGKIKIALNLNITDELKLEGQAREIVRHIQVMRKKAKYNRDDKIMIKYSFTNENKDIEKVFSEWGNYIKKECLAGEIV
ncbi:MAG: class I tRNA ligase family protein, partial [Patescibacteria group bacterium]|nr:class I tRNA ligase family protein [Patescibacteria group bacterium]